MATTMMLSCISVSAGTSVAGTVYDTDYDGISDVTVKMSNIGGLIAEGTTNYRGKFDISLNSDISGEVTIEASKSGYITGRQTKTLESGINPDDIEFVLASGSVRLNISVVGTASSWDYLSNVHCTVRLNDNAVTEGDTFYGSVSLTVNDVVETGAYSITLSKSGFQTLTEPLTLVPGEDQTLSYTLYKDGENPPAETSTIKGNVYSQDDGWNGVAGADVSLLDGENSIGTAKTDDEGDFAITIDGILNGDYTLEVEKEGYETYSATVNFTNGKASNQDINLSRKSTEATVGGLISSESYGSLIDGAKVELCLSDAVVGSAVSSYGQYSIKVNNPESGDYILKVEADGYEPYRSEPFTIAAGESLTKDIAMAKKEITERTTIKGIVKDQYGDGVGDVKITLRQKDSFVDYEFSDNAGEFEFSVRGILNGDYVLITDKYNYSEATLPIAISEGTAPYTEISVVCQSATIVATVTDADSGKAIEKARVEIRLPGEMKVEAESSGEGVYTAALDCVTGNETYQITATADGYEAASKDVVLVPGENKTAIVLTPVRAGISMPQGNSAWQVQGRQLRLFAPGSTALAIYTVDGRLLLIREVIQHQTITLEPGIYIVSFGSDRFKICIQ